MSKTAPTPDDLPFSLARMALSFRRFNDETLRAVGLHDLAPGLASTLHALETLDKCTIGQLVEATQFPNGTLTGLLDSLESQALVTRLPNPADGRSRLLSLTPMGHSVCAKLRERHELTLALLRDTLAPREATQLAQLLDKVSESLRTYKAPARKQARKAPAARSR